MATPINAIAEMATVSEALQDRLFPSGCHRSFCTCTVSVSSASPRWPRSDVQGAGGTATKPNTDELVSFFMRFSIVVERGEPRRRAPTWSVS